jgi:eukaryotic-like serine/threonine-protein kinase
VIQNTWERIQELFAAALELQPEDRAEYVRDRAEDAALRAEVLALLQAHNARGRLDSVADRLGASSAVPTTRLPPVLSGRYRIERELGRGGMATVYLAHDQRHDRKVALKVLQPEIAFALRGERLVREIQIAAKLTHPHILPLHDSGEVDDIVYYVMPYIEGESLRDRLRREKQLPVDEALGIARDVAGALSYAHGHGVVHRDIKPENILLAPGGEALIADFGIARALTVAGGTGSETGEIVGTPVYMSPEQGAGGGEVDGRSDIYSLGCVLYEMLAGHAPFSGVTAQEVIARHALDPIPPLEAVRPGVPPRVAHAVRKALAKRPIDRFAAADQFAAAFTPPAVEDRRARWTAYAPLGLVVLVAGLVLSRQQLLRAPAVSPSGQSVAVLPFVNMSGDTANDYFSEGMTEELINTLSQVEGLRVPARTSSFAFKGKSTSIKQIGQQLGVAHVLEGSVRRVETQLRVTVQLINVNDGYHVWSRTYERELRSARDVFAIQDQLSHAIAEVLSVKLVGGVGGRPVPRSTENLAAYEDYLRGRYFWNRRGRADLLKAIDSFRRAIAQDSGFALAWSGLADASVEAGYLAYLPRERAYGQAKAAALKAVALDSSLAESHTSLARVRQNYDWDWSGAEQEYQKAIRLNPRYALAHSWYGRLLARILGRFDQGIAEARLGLDLDPLSPGASHELGLAYYAARQYDLALDLQRRALDLQPDYADAHQYLGEAYLAKGMLQEAMAEFQAIVRFGGNTGAAWARIGVVHARLGESREALALVRQMGERSTAQPIAAASIAILYAELGDTAEAIDWLERAWADRLRNTGLSLAKTSPLYDVLRSNPRFQALLKRMGLEH